MQLRVTQRGYRSFTSCFRFISIYCHKLVKSSRIKFLFEYPMKNNRSTATAFAERKKADRYSILSEFQFFKMKYAAILLTAELFFNSFSNWKKRNSVVGQLHCVNYSPQQVFNFFNSTLRMEAVLFYI